MSGDFYEDDEPLEDVLADFGPGPHPVTRRPLPPGVTLVEPIMSFATGVAVTKIIGYSPWL